MRRGILQVHNRQYWISFPSSRPGAENKTTSFQIHALWAAALVTGERLSYELWVGLLEKRLECSHLCGNYSCAEGKYSILLSRPQLT
jgi:hypothetical protein